MRDIAIYKDPNHSHNFEAGRFLKIPLDEAATKLIAGNLRAKSQKAVYVILTFEGSPDPNMPIESQWDRVKRRAIEEEVVVYNSARRHGSRAVWSVPPALRTDTNFYWEKVCLYPDQRTLDELGIGTKKIVRNRDGEK